MSVTKKEYVVVYDRDKGKAEVEEFTESRQAVSRFKELTIEHIGHPNIQVNQVNAENREDLEKKWGRWFRHKSP
jgi:hypothetical protein